MVDVRSKQQVVVFTLTPEPPHVCVLDFADNLVQASIDRGYADAMGHDVGGASIDLVIPRFRKELGEPVFMDVVEP